MTVRLILGDQLNEAHSWYREVRSDVCYLMMEVRSETDYVVHHAQKVIAIFAAMRAFAAMLQSQGHTVRYYAIDDPDNPQSFEQGIQTVLRDVDGERFEWQMPDEWRVDAELRRIADNLGIDHACVDTEHFLTTRDEAAQLFARKKQWRLETFYRAMRVKHGVLLEPDGTPVGGEWNYDTENRASWKGTPAAPADVRPMHDHSAIWASIQRSGVQTVGNANAENAAPAYAGIATGAGTLPSLRLPAAGAAANIAEAGRGPTYGISVDAPLPPRPLAVAQARPSATATATSTE
jgi:deoxyribodipyrimidine photolyase-related protein